MNLFGLEIHFANRNGIYVKEIECKEVQNSLIHHLDKRMISLDQSIRNRINEVDKGLNRRIDDIKGLIETIERFILKKWGI